MTLANKIASLLTSLTPGQIAAMAPADRQLLCDQCKRILRLAEAERIGDAAREAPSPPKNGVLADLRDGRGQQ